jgi:hypothetical protein
VADKTAEMQENAQDFGKNIAKMAAKKKAKKGLSSLFG